MSDKVNPEMVRLAREAAGLTQGELAAALSVPQSRISKFEAGLIDPTEHEIGALAATLEREVSFFYWSDRAFGYASHELFHRMRQRISARQVAQIHAMMNIRQMQLERLLRSASIEGDGFRYLDPDDFDGDFEAVALAVRASWHLDAGPVPNIVNAIENAGGVVIAHDFGDRLMDAASQWLPHLPPVFFVNTRFPTDRVRMTLAHEIGHIIMHRTLTPNAEDEANRFAAAFLMPAAEIRHELEDATLPKLAALKPYWKVSIAALTVRAKGLGAITDRQYRRIFMRIGQLGYRTKEPIEIPSEEPKLLKELIDLHMEELNYSAANLSGILAEPV